MDYANKIIVEQCLCGIGNDPLSGEDFLVEAICNYIDNSNPTFTMTETVGDLLSLKPEFAKYATILEAVDVLKEAEEYFQRLKEDEEPSPKMIDKIKANIDKTVNWWFKIDPDSKAKNFRVVLSILSKTALLVLNVKLGAVAIANSAFRHVAKKVASKVNTPDLVKSNMITTPILNGVNLGGLAMSIVSGKSISMHILTFIINGASKIIDAVDKKLVYKINVRDVDENISKYSSISYDLSERIAAETNPAKLAELKKLKKRNDDAVEKLHEIRKLRDTPDERPTLGAKLKSAMEKNDEY